MPSCSNSGDRTVQYESSIKNRSQYLNGLELIELSFDVDTLKCHLVDSRRTFLDEVVIDQNMKYLFQDLLRADFFTNEQIKIYLTVTQRSNTNRISYVDLNIQEFIKAITSYANEKTASKLSELFALNKEYSELEIIDDLNSLSAQYLMHKDSALNYPMGYDITESIVLLSSDCSHYEHFQEMHETIYEFLQEQNQNDSTAYLRLSEYFNSICNLN